MRPIDPTVMVEIVLTITLLLANPTTLDFLRFVQTGALAAGHHTVGLGTGFHILDMLLTALQAIRFTLGQRTGGRALIDALLLIGLTLVDTRGSGLGESGRRQKKGKYGDDLQMLFHGFLLFVANCLVAITRQMT